jgi:hypothetical protein
VPAEVTYDGTTATLNPDIDLTLGKTYKAIIVGGKSGVRGADDEKLGGVQVFAAKFKEGKVFWTFKVNFIP